jgi:4'-phosphopantetheinyl transferase
MHTEDARIASARRWPARGSAGSGPRADRVEIATAALDLAAGSLRALAAVLSSDERERARRFRFERDRCRFIVGRARLRQMLAVRLGVAPAAIEICYGARGKPALAPGFAESGLRFNVSHCGGLAVYAFAQDRELGVDVEEVRPLPDADDVAARFFSARENQAYLALERAERALGFFNCWTRKEALIKALGDGLYHPLDAFDVSLAPGAPARLLRLGDMPGEDCGWTLHSFSPAPGFVGAFAVRGRT